MKNLFGIKGSKRNDAIINDLIKPKPIMKRTIILDPAHGADVAGKRSPDGKHRECFWSRELCTKIENKLTQLGVIVKYSNGKNENEIGLTNRVKNMNAIDETAFVFSLHNNAAGMGDKWYNARGASIWTTKGVTKSDNFASIIFMQLLKDFPDIANWRKDTSDGDVDYESNFTVLTSKHPSVLLEWQFQDNMEDVKLLMDPAMNDRLVDSLVTALYQIAQS